MTKLVRHLGFLFIICAFQLAQAQERPFYKEIQQFKKQFPKSANPSFALPQSLFEIATKEKGANFQHVMLMRKSKDDPNATPMIEFTFDNGRLIFILFANF